MRVRVVACGMIAVMAVGGLPSVALPGGDVLPFEHNDADSGRDAPERPDPDFVVGSTERHHGQILGSNDTADTYGFVTPAGETWVYIRFWSLMTDCPAVYLPSMERHPYADCFVFDPYSSVILFKTYAADTFFVKIGRPGYLVGVSPYMYNIQGPDDLAYQFNIDYSSVYPTLTGEGSFVHDDAGSGRDAEGHWGGDVWPSPGIVYEGQLIPVFDDTADWYRLHIEDVQTIQVKVAGFAMQCPRIWDPSESVDRDCDISPEGDLVTVTANLTHNGRHYIDLRSHVSPPINYGTVIPGIMLTDYRFSYALDGEAPDPRA